MNNSTIEFVLWNSSNEFFVEGDRPTTNVDSASRYPTFAEASVYKPEFQKQNEAVETCVRPVRLTIQLLD